MWLEVPVRGVMLDVFGVLCNSGDCAITGSVDATVRLVPAV